MPGPIEAAGAVRNPSKYGALGMGARQFTGLVTQRSPYRDGAVPYLVGKFYGGSRFDTILDGLNREISQRLTDVRAPGSSVYNSNTFPGINSFYPWKYIQDGAEVIRVIADGKDGAIYDATAGQKTQLYATAPEGPRRFVGVNTELFFGDGVQTKKILRSSKVWAATTLFDVNDFIIDPNQNVQLVRANPVNATITDVEVVFSAAQNVYYVILTLSADAPVIAPNWTASFSGLTTYVALNGQTLPWKNLSAATLQELDLGADQIAFEFGAAPYGPAADTGTMVALTQDSAISGGAMPAWNVTTGGTTADGALIWTNMGPAVENWGLAGAPYKAPSYTSDNVNPFVAPSTLNKQNIRYWYPGIVIAAGDYFALLDPNGSIQLAHNSTGSSISNPRATQLPNWSSQIGGATMDGDITWICYGPAGARYDDTDYGGASTGVPNPCVILDDNGNLQATSDLSSALTSFGSPVSFATTIGATTTDGAITWICVGPGSVLWSGTYEYSYSFEAVDGSVSTAQPVTLVANGGLGLSGSFALEIAGNNSTDTQCKNIIIWRTPQDQSTLIFADRIPNPSIGTPAVWNYVDVAADKDLNPFIPAPVAESNDPPDPTMTAPVYYQQRIWGIVQNRVVYSGGPDTITGNGNTAFAPLSEIPFLAQPIKLFPVLVQNGGLIVMTTSGIKIILGTGTASNPYYVGDYLELVSILSYDAATIFYNQIFCMESNGKVSSLAIEYPFNPQSGYTEVGFPIGDQFVKTTTGGQNSALFTPATSYVSWNANSSGDTGMYVSNGAGFWFRMSLINPPESGILWSPLRQLEGGASAVQSVETTPGIRNLLIGPPTGTPGPILMRDTTGTVWTDDPAGTPTPYPSWDAKGVTLLCSTGQWAEVVHVSTKSKAVGKRPIISVLLNEIAPSLQRPYKNLNLDDKSNDPSKTPRSISAYSDRYVLKQSGANTLGDCLLAKFDYGAQAEGDELLDWGIFARVHEEREEEAAPAR